MAYRTDEERRQAIKDSKRRYYLKTYKRVVQEKRNRKETIVRPKEYWLHARAKNRAKVAGIPFELEISDIIIPEFCPALGIKLSIDNTKNIPNSPSIDRLDNTLGYTKNNIRVISWRANKIKSDASLVEIEGILKYMKESS